MAVTDVETTLQERADATKLPTGSEVTTIKQDVQQDELLKNPAQLSQVSMGVGQVPTTGLEVTVPQTKSAEKYTAQTIQGTPEAVAAQGKLSSEAVVGDITGTVSEQSLVQAAQGQVSEESTVKYQIGELFKSFEEGNYKEQIMSVHRRWADVEYWRAIKRRAPAYTYQKYLKGIDMYENEKGEIIGELRSACYSPHFKKVIGIAMLDKPYYEVSQAFKISINDSTFEGKVCDLPFI